MILFKKFRYLPAVALMVLAFTACDDDFNTIGGELVGGQLDAFPRYEAGVVAYNKKLSAVQTNNLPLQLLGVYNEPVYGQQQANVLAQLSLSANNPGFGNEPRLDSVVLTLPYFSTKQENDAQGNAVYKLDSIYGNSPFKLTISRSGYFLNDFDPEANFESRQRYYSDQGPLFESNLIGEPIYVNESFMPSPREVVYRQLNEEGELDTTRVSPRMRINLSKEFFKTNILDKAGSTELSNTNNFRNFLRGLYFKAEAVNGDGSIMSLNFNNSDAGIVLYFTNIEEEDGEEIEKQGSFRINFGNNNVNTFTMPMPAAITQEIAASSEAPGAANLFLRGGEGSMAVIELFEDEAELEELRTKNWLINEANLTFYVNQERVVGGVAEPSRVLLYNLATNQLLADYGADPSAASENPELAVRSHSPQLVRDEDENGIYYKIRITEHVRRILSQDAENVKLGLVVTQNIKVINYAALKQPVDGIDRVPTASVISPKGTVLHGNLSPNADKRLKFNIFYTETNN